MARCPHRVARRGQRACSDTCNRRNGHVRGIACGDDGKRSKWIAFRTADTPLESIAVIAPDTRWCSPGHQARRIKRGNAAEMHGEDAAPANRNCSHG